MAVIRHEIMPCRLSHIRELARTMRAEDRAEFEGAGLVVRHRLHELWRMSPTPRAALVDGQVAAAWGDAAGLIAPEGLMWMATAPPVERVPLTFFREARREIGAALQIRRTLRSCIAGPYRRAIRFYSMLGFSIEAPVEIGGIEYRTIRITAGG